MKIQLEVIPPEESENAILTHKASIAVTLADHETLKSNRQTSVRLHPLVKEELFCALSENHHLAQQDYIDIADIKNERFVLHPSANGPLYKTFFANCADQGFTPRQIPSTSDFLTRFGMVASGAALTLTPAAVVIGNKPAGVVFKSFTTKIEAWIVAMTQNDFSENEKIILDAISNSTKIHFSK